VIDQYTESILIFTGLNIVLALGLYLPVSTGLLSLGQGGFMALGAYGSAVLTSKLGWPLLPALAGGAALAGGVGLVVGFPALRIKGVYLIILTMGFGEIVRIFFLNFEPTGGASGIGGIKHLTTLPLVMGVAALMLLCLMRFRGARIGRALRAVQEDEVAAEAMGVNLTRVKVAAFALGALGAGIGGGLYAHQALFIDPGQFGFFRSAEIFLIVVLGGLGTYWGPVVGAAVVTLLPELLRFVQDWRMTVFGSLLVLCAVLRPAGLLSGRRRPAV
jgi:branched-chain amino acid transport system permease protein